MPANSAAVVPRFATTRIVVIANGRAHAEALADQAGEALPGDGSEPHRDRVVEDEHRRGDDEHPDQRVAVVGAEDRVGRDAGGVVVGEAGEDARARARRGTPRCAAGSSRRPRIARGAGGALARGGPRRRGASTSRTACSATGTGRRESRLVTVSLSSCSKRSRGASSSSAPAAALGTCRRSIASSCGSNRAARRREAEAPQHGCGADLDRRRPRATSPSARRTTSPTRITRRPSRSTICRSKSASRSQVGVDRVARSRSPTMPRRPARQAASRRLVRTATIRHDSPALTTPRSVSRSLAPSIATGSAEDRAGEERLGSRLPEATARAPGAHG